MQALDAVVSGLSHKHNAIRRIDSHQRALKQVCVNFFPNAENDDQDTFVRMLMPLRIWLDDMSERKGGACVFQKQHRGKATRSPSQPQLHMFRHVNDQNNVLD